MNPKRKIPSSMASQHPDNAGVPYWGKDTFINSQQESNECFLTFSDLGIDEYKWDWEGKLVDESVIERLLGEHFDYFSRNQLGKDKFLTFRLPNPKVEHEFRVGRALMGILSASLVAKQFKLHTPALFEVILPMTESEKEMIDIVEAYKELANLKHPLYKFGNGLSGDLEIIPLFEQVTTIMRADGIIKDYLKLYKKKFGKNLKYLRPYVARSDPALNSGLVATVLAIKIALSKFSKFQEAKLFPIIGSASLVFRGGLTPETIEDFCSEYQGIKTALLQSAFRYDYPKDRVTEGVKKLNELLPKSSALKVRKKDEKQIFLLIDLFTYLYRSSIENLAPLINQISEFVPRRRERVQHIGLFGYSRGVGKVKLPRAITFTAALYSIGIPPEFIGIGRGLKKAKKEGMLDLLNKYYLNLKKDLWRAGRFINKNNLRDLAKKDKAWKDVEEDIKEVEEFLGMEFMTIGSEEKNYQKIIEKIYKQLEIGIPPTELITEAAIMRKSLG